jgi:hypothetical protein
MAARSQIRPGKTGRLGRAPQVPRTEYEIVTMNGGLPGHTVLADGGDRG